MAVSTAIVLLMVDWAAAAQRAKRSPASSFGEIAGVWSYGAPGPASPGLVNMANDDGCFPGVRAWNAANRVWDNLWVVDAVPIVTGAVSYAHAKMATRELDVTMEDVKDVRWIDQPCTDKAQDTPTAVPDPSLHLKTTYSRNSRVQGGFYANVSDAAAVMSYFNDQTYVRERAKVFGWRLVDTAYDDGNNLVGGPQPSHLMQNPDTLECLITFQGSQSIQDWFGNALFSASHFCGFVDEDETCDGLFDSCAVRNYGGAFVHSGFRDHLRNIVGNETWQERVRAHLPYCSKVHVGGHSLGGATSELFAACVNRAPAPGSYGHEDFDLISWTPKTPKQLEYF